MRTSVIIAIAMAMHKAYKVASDRLEEAERKAKSEDEEITRDEYRAAVEECAIAKRNLDEFFQKNWE